MVTNIFDKTHLATKAATEFSVQWSSLSLTRCCAISFDTSGPLHNNSSVSVILWVTKISWVNTQSATKPFSTGPFGRHNKSAMFLFIEIIHQGLIAKNAFYSAKRQICTWQKLAVEMTCWGDGHDSQHVKCTVCKRDFVVAMSMVVVANSAFAKTSCSSWVTKTKSILDSTLCLVP